ADLLNDFGSFRSLDCQKSEIVGGIDHFAFKIADLLANPFKIFCGIGRIHAKKEIVVAALVDEKVVDGATIGAAHRRIDCFAVGLIGDPIGQQIIEKSARLRTLNENFAHVAYVEKTGRSANGSVLVKNAA